MSTTLVTGLWNIKRESLQEGWSRSYEHYLECFSKLLKTECNLIIYGDEELEKFVSKQRNEANTQFIKREADWFKKSGWYDKVQEIRTSEKWKAQSGWLESSTQGSLEMYNPLVMSKMFLLNDAKILSKFDSDNYFWIDAGISNTVSEGYYKDDSLLSKINTNTFTFVAFPYEANNEIHGFPYPEINNYADGDVKLVARGGFFGGSKYHIDKLNGIYYNLLMETLNRGHMGTEESLFSIIMYSHPELCGFYEIEGNGLVYKFFEDLQENVAVKKTIKGKKVLNKDSMALYILSFNSPEQFGELLLSMDIYDKDILKIPNKYLLDNSTDNSFSTYSQICKERGFEHIKKDNIGITGGRQFIAEHFEETGLDYYVFFEDDMQLYEGSETTCPLGFPRKIDKLLSKSLEIVYEHEYDFLKLSFKEFYGNNSDQWAWHNLPQEKRDEFFPDTKEKPKTVFTKIYTHKGLPFAEGEIFLCNWPIIFTKAGNKKSYIDTIYKYPAEQTLMSHNFQLHKKGVMKTAVLLASPIEHYRFDHYEEGLRKEN